MYKITPELDEALEKLEQSLSELMSQDDPAYHGWDYYRCAFCGHSECSDRYVQNGIKHHPNCLGKKLEKALSDARE